MHASATLVANPFASINRTDRLRAFTDVIAPVGLRVKADAFDVRLYITE